MAFDDSIWRLGAAQALAVASAARCGSIYDRLRSANLRDRSRLSRLDILNGRLPCCGDRSGRFTDCRIFDSGHSLAAQLDLELQGDARAACYPPSAMMRERSRSALQN